VEEVFAQIDLQDSGIANMYDFTDFISSFKIMRMLEKMQEIEELR